MGTRTGKIIVESKTFWRLFAIKLDRRISGECMQNKAQRNSLHREVEY